MKWYIFSLVCFLAVFAACGTEYDLSGANMKREWYLGRFKRSGFVKGEGFVVRGGEYGSLVKAKSEIDSRKYGTLKVIYRGKAWKSAKLYFSDGGNFKEAASVRGRDEGGVIVFNCHRNRNWQGTVRRFRVDILPDGKEDVIIRKLVFSAADNTRTVYSGDCGKDVEFELLIPGGEWAWRGRFAADISVKYHYFDVYGKCLKTGNILFGSGNTSGRETAPENTASVKLSFSGSGGRVHIWQDVSEQKIKAEKNLRSVTVTGIPDRGDEKSVIDPVVIFPSEQKSARLQLELVSGKMRIIAADRTVDGKKVKLPVLTMKYLTSGRYRVVVRVNGKSVPLEKEHIYEHRNLQTDFQFPLVKVKHDGNRAQYEVNGKAIDTTEYLSSDPPLSDDAIRHVDKAAQIMPVLAYRLIFRFDRNGNADYRELDSSIQSLLLRHPEKAVFIHVSVTDPGPGYRKNHPEEGIKDDKGEFRIKNYRDKAEATTSMASEKWQQSSEDMIKNLVKHLKQVPYGSRVIGIMPCSGITWEWLHWGSARGVMVDYSEHYRKFYAEFLRKRYGTIDKLNRAWKSSYRNFREIKIPSPERRLTVGKIDFRCGTEFQELIDHADSVSALVSGIVIRLCRTVKEASGGRILSGTYYGYVNYLLAGGRSHDCGHNDFYKVLTSPYVDVLMAPSRYAGRGLGGGGGFMHPEGSVKLHRKLIISECDVRTPAAASGLGRTVTLAGTRAVLEREYAAQLAGGSAMRFFDFSHGWITGDARIFDVAERIVQHSRRRCAENSSTMPEKYIAGVFSSAKTSPRLERSSKMNIMLLENGYQELLKSGAAFSMYAMEDFGRVANKHKLLILQNTLYLNESERKAVAEAAKKPGRMIVFNSGSGMIGDMGIDSKFMSELLGCGFDVDMEKRVRSITITAQGEKILGIPAGRKYIVAHPCAPVFYPQDGVVVLAQSDDGKCALALKRNPGGADIIWSALPLLNGEIIQALAERCQLPVVKCSPQVPVWFNRGVLAVHAAKSVKIRFDFRNFPLELREWNSAKSVPLNCKRSLPKESTWLLDMNWKDQQ
ncbi:MAG: beta-galactosidase [Lentisphaeria bacterium]|nr:beta-galactosidase [Lentisphaeria bacterium]